MATKKSKANQGSQDEKSSFSSYFNKRGAVHYSYKISPSVKFNTSSSSKSVAPSANTQSKKKKAVDSSVYDFDLDEVPPLQSKVQSMGSASQTATNDASQSPIKRGRGRPKKNDTTSFATPTKPGPGRPPLSTTQSATPAQSITSDASSSVKRGRGRPRKTPVSITSTPSVTPSQSISSISTDSVKRGRGRPRKTPTSVTPQSNLSFSSQSSDSIKRGRGRPRKHPVSVTPQSNISIDSQSSDSAKRGPGRPRKYPLSVTPQSDISINSLSSGPVKRGPGRPRKHPLSVSLKRGRGRPKKPKIEDSMEVEGEDPLTEEEVDATSSRNLDFTTTEDEEEDTQPAPSKKQREEPTTEEESDVGNKEAANLTTEEEDREMDETDASQPSPTKRGRPRKQNMDDILDFIDNAETLAQGEALPTATPITTADDEASQGSSVVKRGRGRPRKNEAVSISASVTTEDESGTETSTSSFPVKRGRGRPPKTASGAKRGRGRPRITDTDTSYTTESEPSVSQKLPPKVPTVDRGSSDVSSTTSGIKRGRGRPPKVPKVSKDEGSSQDSNVTVKGHSQAHKDTSDEGVTHDVTTVSQSTNQVQTRRSKQISGTTPSVYPSGQSLSSVGNNMPSTVTTVVIDPPKDQDPPMASGNGNQDNKEEQALSVDVPVKRGRGRPPKKKHTNTKESTIPLKVPRMEVCGSSIQENTVYSSLEQLLEHTLNESSPLEDSSAANSTGQVKVDNGGSVAAGTAQDKIDGEESAVPTTDEAPLPTDNDKPDGRSQNDDKTVLDVVDKMEEERQSQAESEKEAAVKEKTPDVTGRPSLEGSADLSITETEFRQKDFDRHLKRTTTDTSSTVTTTSAVAVPNLARSSTWPKDGSGKVTLVRNVRQAHECLQHGENLQFRDELEYIIDNMKPTQPLPVRCLSTLNLATECLKTDFIRLLRAHGLISKIISLTKDTMEHQTLQVAMVTLLYVITKDKLESNELDRSCIELLYKLMQSFVTDNDGNELEGKTAKEYEKIKKKSRAVLQKCPAIPLRDKDRQKEQATNTADASEMLKFDLLPCDLSYFELSCECLMSLTSVQSSCHWLRESMRMLGIIDLVADKVLASIADSCNKIAKLSEAESKGEKVDDNDIKELTDIFVRLLRHLGLLENTTFMNKGNQSYLTVYDGSLLVTKLCSVIVPFQNYLLEGGKNSSLRCLVLENLLGVLRLLLNLTHDHELGSHRVSEQVDVVQSILTCVFELCRSISQDKQFDILVLSIGLLINLVEHSSSNRNVLHAWDVSQVTDGDSKGEEKEPAVNAFIKMFLLHNKRAEEATIAVPTPQRLSQLTPQSSPMKSQTKTSLASRLKHLQDTKATKSPNKLSQDSKGEENDEEDEEEEEEPEDGAISDPFVFSKEDFDSALVQAGQHMEDSIISSYVALLLSVLAKHNSEFADNLKQSLPDKNFSSLINVLKQFVSFMNMMGSSTTRSGLDSIKKILKQLEVMDKTEN